MKREYVELINSLEEEIEITKTRIKLFEKYESVYNYFLPIKRQRNPYLTSMRVIIAFRMFKDGMIQNDIATVLSRDHSSVSHIFNKEIIEDHIHQEVLEKMDQWMLDKVYPSTVGVYVKKQDQKHETDKWRLTYKLKPI